jgi:hypothetical protein
MEMAKANPKAWFVSCIAKIYYRPVDKWAVQRRAYEPYFDTWQEAHNWMIKRAVGKIAQYEKSLQSLRRHLAKLQSMKDPTSEPNREGV